MKKIICMWKGCKEIASHLQLDKHGKEWSNLCDKHHKELEDSMKDLSPKKILKSWVLAKGGAEKAAKDMF